MWENKINYEKRKAEYSKFLKTKYWENVKSIVLLRDEFKCTKCNSKTTLQVHHKTYNNHLNELNHLEDLITLCRCCHKKEHNIKPKRKFNPRKKKEPKLKTRVIVVKPFDEN